MKKPNIIWILVDSVRNYKTDSDERGRLDVMDEITDDFVDFRTAITAAPSTIMSVSAMMTGIPASYQSRDYESFKYQYDKMETLPLILKKNGYNTFGIISWPDGRNFLGNMFGDICKDLWENDFDKNEYWSNDIQIDIFNRFLNSDKVKEPFFVWLHTNCRNDIKTSDKVKGLLAEIKKKNLYDDSIIVINSDHGYPDPNRGISFYDKRKYGHDLIMTDDNILAPQLIKLPGVNAKRIDQPISTLDLFPTILDYLDLEDQVNLSIYPTSGKSLLPLIKGLEEYKTRIVRTDNRFVFQKNSVVSLRDENYKYIKYLEDNVEEFYSIKDDLLEENNLVSDKNYSTQLEFYRKQYNQQYNDILAFHASVLNENFSSIVSKDADYYTIIGEFNSAFVEIFSKLFEDNGYKLSEFIQDKYKDVKILTTNNAINGTNVLVFPVSKNPRLNTEIVNCGKHFGVKKNISYLNYNLESIVPPSHWFIVSIRKSKKWFQAFKYEPKTILIDFLIQLKRIILNDKI